MLVLNNANPVCLLTLRPNFMNLSRGLNPPKAFKSLIQFLLEPTIFEPWLKFFKFGLSLVKTI